MTQASKMRKADRDDTRSNRALLACERAMPGFMSVWFQQTEPIRVVTSGVACKMGVGGRKHRRHRRTHPPGPARVKPTSDFVKMLDMVARGLGKRKPNKIPNCHRPEQRRAHHKALRCRFERRHRGAHHLDPMGPVNGFTLPCPICNPVEFARRFHEIQPNSLVTLWPKAAEPSR